MLVRKHGCKGVLEGLPNIIMSLLRFFEQAGYAFLHCRGFSFLALAKGAIRRGWESGLNHGLIESVHITAA